MASVMKKLLKQKSKDDLPIGLDSDEDISSAEEET
jgi:hypothetical protein